MTRTLGLVVTASVLACGDGSGPAPTSTPDPDPNVLTIELRPVHEIRWGGVLSPEGELLRGTEIVPLALGEGYPDALEVVVDEAWANCGALQGEITIDSVESQDDGLDVDFVGSSAFRLVPAREGDFEAIVRGTFVADVGPRSCVGAQAQLELHVSVPVRSPAGVLVHPPQLCAESDRFFVESEGHLGSGLRVSLVDAAGEPFDPRNAAPSHPATLTLEANPGTQLSLHTPDEGLAALVVSGEPGLVDVLAFGEPQAGIEHVAPAAIEVVGAAFELLGFGGGPTPLEHGQVYGASGWARTSASIGIASSGLEVEGQQICTLPRRDAFVLESSTPQTCIAYAELGHGDGPYGESFGDPPVPVSAEVVASGTCTLQLDAPEYAGGEGFSTGLSVDILNAEQLARVEGR